ncbi:winged helix-turn-helix domain-containing protein, partial [Akkermansiaceae bacterium]|nr:winged helix-turn-helix domain-containing protein [Akkermansiaceae bacterium]
KFRDSRTIPPEQLYERRKQAVALRKTGMSFLEIAQIVGVRRRDVGGRWYAMWQEGGMKALKVGARGTPKGSGLRLNTFEQERIRKSPIEKSPDQLKMPFALWTRDAVRLLVKEIYGYDLPIRTSGRYLKCWNFTPQPSNWRLH